MIVRHWEDVSASYGAAEGLLLQYLTRHPMPLSIVSAILMAIRSEIIARAKKKSTVQLEKGLEKFSNLQASFWPLLNSVYCCADLDVFLFLAQELILDALQENFRGVTDTQGSKLMRLLAIIDPQALNDGKTGQEGAETGRGDHEKPLTLGDFRPLRVALADSDARFFATPLLETFTRLAWRVKQNLPLFECLITTCKVKVVSDAINKSFRPFCRCGQEFAMETCMDGQHSALSFLNPSLLFLVMCALGFANPNGFMPLELMSKVNHMHTWTSQVTDQKRCSVQGYSCSNASGPKLQKDSLTPFLFLLLLHSGILQLAQGTMDHAARGKHRVCGCVHAGALHLFILDLDFDKECRMLLQVVNVFLIPNWCVAAAEVSSTTYLQCVKKRRAPSPIWTGTPEPLNPRLTAVPSIAVKLQATWSFSISGLLAMSWRRCRWHV